MMLIFVLPTLVSFFFFFLFLKTSRHIPNLAQKKEGQGNWDVAVDTETLGGIKIDSKEKGDA